MIEKINLNSYWKFLTDPCDSGRSKNWFKSIPEGVSEIYVPSCWNECDDEWYHYEGVAWYFKKFLYKDNKNIKRNTLFFYGVNYSCEIWLNGKPAGAHTGGFTPFEIDVTGLLKRDGENFIAVRVDNTMTASTVPPIGVDWFNFGGIFREVFLQGTGEGRFDDVYVTTKISGDINIRVQLEDRIKQAGDRIRIVVRDDDMLDPVIDRYDEVSADEMDIALKINEPKLWSTETPFLYRFELSLISNGVVQDRWEHRIGIREFSIKNRRILLNGKPIMMRGYSKHEEYPNFGRTFSKDIIRKDYEICKKGNANFLRLCHYPHHLYEYELASEMGFVVLAETPNGNFIKLHFEDKDILENAVNQTKEMLKYLKNETCIIFWNLFMESATNEPGAMEFIPGYIRLVKDIDPTRLTIHASLIPLDDPAANYFDVIGINYWSGWYYGETIEEGSEYLDKIGAKYSDKPVVMTSGGWEGIYGFHSYNRNEKWSEEEQAKYLTEVSRMYISKDYTVGEIIWTFNDFRVSPWILDNSGRWTLRPMELNHKGVVDYFRRPKLSYFAMQKVFKEWDDKK